MPKFKQPEQSEKVVPRIAEAVGIAVKLPPGMENRAKLLEDAMSKAVLDCSAQGITDPNVIREAMRQAREKVKADIAAAEAKAIEEAQK